LTERRWLIATSLLATAVPLAASRVLADRVDSGLAPALARLTGQPVAVGGVDAGLTGTVRLTDLAVGDLVEADAAEASVGMGSLLGGRLRADEIRVEAPRLRARIDGAGGSDLARVVQRVAARRPAVRRGPSSGPERLRRVVVTEGALVVDVVGLGRLEARGVELHPQAGGVRVVTGPITVRGGRGVLTVAAQFERSGADLALGAARFGRAVAVGGTVRADVGGEPLVVRGAVVGHALQAGPPALTLIGSLDDRGVPQALVVAARPDAVHVRAASVPLAALAPLVPAGVDLGDAHAAGSATLARTGDRVRFDVVGEIGGVAIDHPAVSPAAVPIDVTAAARGALAGLIVELDAAHVTRGALTMRATGRLRRGGAAGVNAGELDLSIDRAGCLALLEALPPPLRGPLGGLTLTGEASAQARLRLDLDQPAGDGVELETDLDLGCAVVADAPLAEPARLAGASEHVFPDGSRALVGPGLGDWVRLDQLPAMVPLTWVAAEDARFFTHRGFDLGQIARSLEVDLREARFARGGSTISQQLVKNAFLTPRRSLDRKLQEAILTWRVEATLDKRTILERYLNVIELGPGVHGISAAARHWFGKPATLLSAREVAFLAAMTPEPTSMSRRLAAAGGLDPQSAERVDTVLRAMRRAGVIRGAEADAARGQPLALRAAALRPVERR
jgi:hypothetical protein